MYPRNSGSNDPTALEADFQRLSGKLRIHARAAAGYVVLGYLLTQSVA
jgi:hypothetical protein